MAKSKINGHVAGTAPQLHVPQPPTDTSPFVIGGETIHVPALTLDVIERCRTSLLALSPDLSWIDYASNVIDIISVSLSDTRPELTSDVLVKACTLGEAQAMPLRFSELLAVSGFLPGEAVAVTESPGTSTPMPSPESLRPRESAEGTSTGSSEAIP